MQLYNIFSFGSQSSESQIVFLIFSLALLFLLKVMIPEKYSDKLLSKISIASCACCLLSTLIPQSENSFSKNTALYWVMNILLASSLFWMLSISFSTKRKQYSSLSYMIILSLTLSFVICLSVDNLLLMLIGLDIHTISSVFLLIFKKNAPDKKATMIKLLLISAISSAVFLYGMSLIYCNFNSVQLSAITPNIQTFSAKLGVLLILISILFKLSVAPLHMFAINCYRHCSISSILFFSTISKLFFVTVLIKICYSLFEKGITYHKLLLYIVAILSMSVGGIMAIVEKNIKKFIGYVSTGNIGIALIVLTTATQKEHFNIAILFIISNTICTNCFVEIIKALKKRAFISNFDDIQGIGKIHPSLSYMLTISLLALAGLPPFALFLSKIDIIKLILLQKHWILLFITCFYSLLCSIYFIKHSRNIFTNDTSMVKEHYTKSSNISLILSFLLLIISTLLIPSINF